MSQLAGSLGNMALKAGAGALGGYLGGPAGAAFGASLFGSGDYKVSENSLVLGTQVPVFREGKRSVIIKHREYITDILSSTTFSNRSYSINPGLSESFPWLSQVVSNFEQYKFHGLLWEFKSTSGSAVSSTNNALGVVVMATEYNANKSAFVNKQQMEAYEFSCSGKASDSFLHPVECSPSDTPYNNFYVRTGEITGDLRLYDVGNFQIATQGMQAASINIGELWVTYEIELLKPILPVAGYLANFARLRGAEPDTTNYFGAIIPAWLGTMQPVVSAAGAGYDTVTLPANILAGNYKLEIVWRGDSTATVLPSIVFTNATILNAYRLDTLGLNSNGGTTSATLFLEVYFSVDNYTGSTPASFRLGSTTTGTLPANGTYVDMSIAQVTSDFAVSLAAERGYHLI